MRYIGWYEPNDFIYIRPWFFSYRKEYYFCELCIFGFLFEEIYNQGE